MLAACAATGLPCLAGATMRHGFDTVGSTLWGWIGGGAGAAEVAFYAQAYTLVVIGGAGNKCNASDPDSYDAFELAR